MFTGIVTDIGSVRALHSKDEGKRLEIATRYDPSTIELGASIACDGVCLTVVELPDTASSENWFAVEAWAEALALTTLGGWKIGKKINLERSLKVGDELGGHIVSGHVDGTATVVSRIDEGEAVRFRLQAPDQFARFIAPKGSIALNGTSLTVNKVDGPTFDVLLIKHSLEVTTWSDVTAEVQVNLEVDTMARYAARLMEFH